MGRFKVGDRVRFIKLGYDSSQAVGCEATVIGLDFEGNPVVDTDPKAGQGLGWTDEYVELVSGSAREITTTSLLDQFAMAALTSATNLAVIARSTGGEPWTTDQIVECAYQYAQAMMKAREVQK